MERIEFTDIINGLAANYSKTVVDRTVQEWYKDFGWLFPAQLKAICQDLKSNCERFPTIKDFLDAIKARGFRKAGDGVVLPSRLISVVCACGEGFALERSVLGAGDEMFVPAYIDKSEKRIINGCQSCGAMYTVGLVRASLKDDVAVLLKCKICKRVHGLYERCSLDAVAGA